MRIHEFVNEEEDEDDEGSEEIAAVSQLIADQTEDADSESKISLDSFIHILNKMGISQSKESLTDMVGNGSFSDVIKNINGEEVMFKGQQEIDPEIMSVDKARDTVNDMAKRSMNKGGLGSKPDPQDKEGYN